ncbi:MAG: QueT transporter family protein [Lachnospiraceae bacterium]|nr:QueT transporter family protein [Lachnospiraceae bacterium]
MKKNTLFLVHAAAIAALYTVLTLLANAFGLANYAIQVRFSEALTVLPWFTPAAIPGLFAGCLLSNLLTGALPQDVIFGSLATLLGAVGTWLLGKAAAKIPAEKRMPWKFLAPVPPIVANILIIPPILAFVYRFEGTIPYFMLTVGLGEIISCGILGMILFFSLEKRPGIISPDRDMHK